MVLLLAAASLLSLSAQAANLVQSQSGPVVPVLSIPSQTRQLSFSDIAQGLSWTNMLPGIPGLPVTSQIMNLVGPKLEPAGPQETVAKAPAATALPITAGLPTTTASSARPAGRFTPAPLATGQNATVGAQKHPQSLTAMTQKAATEALGNLKALPTSNGEGASSAGGKFWDGLTAGGGSTKRVEDQQQGTGKGGHAAAGGELKGDSSSSHDGPSSWAPQAPKTQPDTATRLPSGGSAGAGDFSAVGGRHADDAPDLGRTPQSPIPGGDLEQGAPTAAPPVALIALRLVGQGFILSDSGPELTEKKTVNGSPSQLGENTPSTVASSAVAGEAYSAFQSVEGNGFNDLRDAVSAAPQPYSTALADAGAAELFSFTSPATLLARSHAAARRASIPAKEPPFGGRRPASRSGEPAWLLLLPLAALAVRYRTEFL